MTVIYEGIEISLETVRAAVKGVTVFSAAGVAYRMGFRNVDSNHGAYRPVLRRLNQLHDMGEISKAYFDNNVSVFYHKCGG